MAIEPEDGAPHNPALETPPQGVESVTIPKKDLDELRHRADVSSQNFERLKKAEQDLLEKETRIAELETQEDPSGKNNEEIKKLQSDIAALTAGQVRNEVLEKYPVLKDSKVWTDFESFRNEDENKGLNIKTAAKAFLVEKGILDSSRKGLEPPAGGDRTPALTGMSVEEVKNLRETDYKKYRDFIKKGVIKIS